jgi:hypothetical protein
MKSKEIKSLNVRLDVNKINRIVTTRQTHNAGYMRRNLFRKYCLMFLFRSSEEKTRNPLMVKNIKTPGK